MEIVVQSTVNTSRTTNVIPDGTIHADGIIALLFAP